MSTSSADCKQTEKTRHQPAKVDQQLFPTITANLLDARTMQSLPDARYNPSQREQASSRVGRDGQDAVAVLQLRRNADLAQASSSSPTDSPNSQTASSYLRSTITRFRGRHADASEGHASQMGKGFSRNRDGRTRPGGDTNRRQTHNRKAIAHDHRRDSYEDQTATHRPNRDPLELSQVDAALEGHVCNKHAAGPLKPVAIKQPQLFHRVKDHEDQSKARRESEQERASAKKKRNEKAGVFSLSDTQLQSRYEFIKEIGYGEWGSIWTARPVRELEHLPTTAYAQVKSRKLNGAGYVLIDNSQNYRPLAIKMCTRERNTASAARTERLWNEFKVLRSIIDASPAEDSRSGSSLQAKDRADRIFGSDWHVNVVKFYEFVITPTFTMITMPWYDEPMKVGLPDDRCRTYFQQLLSAMFWLHQKNISHNDIKVGNILVNYDGGILGKGTPILVDFGFATLHDPLKKDAFKTNVSWGTPEYLAPERARGEYHDERGSDLWSLGVTFFEIATTRTPFEQHDEQFVTREQMQAYYHRTMSGVWVGSWEISAELEDLIRRMLNPSPDGRIEAAEALLHPYFDPTCSYYENSLEDILSLSSTDDEERDRRKEELMPNGKVVPDPFPAERLLNPSNSEPLLRDEHTSRPPTWTDERNRIFQTRKLTPPSPSLSAIGMDSCVTDIMRNTPPWSPDTVPRRLSAKPSGLATTKPLVPGSDSDGDHCVLPLEISSGAGLDIPQVQVDSPKMPKTPSKPHLELVIGRPDLISPSPFRLAPTTSTPVRPASSTVLVDRNDSPLKAAIKNNATRRGGLELTPARSGHLPSPMKRNFNDQELPVALDSPVSSTQPRLIRKSRSLQGCRSMMKGQEDFFLAAPESQAGLETGQVKERPRSAVGGRNISLPKQGTHVVASLAKKFDGAIAPLTYSARNSLDQPRSKATPTRGHRKSQSCTIATQTSRSPVTRASIGVQVDPIQQTSNAKEEPRPPELARTPWKNRTVVDEPVTPDSSIGDESLSVESCSTSESSPEKRDRLAPECIATRTHRPISASFGFPPIPHPSSSTTTAKLPPLPATDSRLHAHRRSTSEHHGHRRTKTDVDGNEVMGRLNKMGDIAETLARMIDDTRAALLGGESFSSCSHSSSVWQSSEEGRKMLNADVLLESIKELEQQAGDISARHAAATRPALISREYSIDLCSYDAEQQQRNEQGRASEETQETISPERVRTISATTVMPHADAAIPASPPPPLPSRERVEKIYSSYLLRNQTVKKHGEGFQQLVKTPSMHKLNRFKTKLPLGSPSEDPLAELLSPISPSKKKVASLKKRKSLAAILVRKREEVVILPEGEESLALTPGRTLNFTLVNTPRMTFEEMGVRECERPKEVGGSLGRKGGFGGLWRLLRGGGGSLTSVHK